MRQRVRYGHVAIVSLFSAFYAPGPIWNRVPRRRTENEVMDGGSAALGQHRLPGLPRRGNVAPLPSGIVPGAGPARNSVSIRDPLRRRRLARPHTRRDEIGGRLAPARARVGAVT